MKNLSKSTLAFLATIFVLGGIVAIASVLDCGAPCDFAAAQAKDLSAALAKARAEQAAAQVSATQPQ